MFAFGGKADIQSRNPGTPYLTYFQHNADQVT